jgi:hypothetical protein
MTILESDTGTSSEQLLVRHYGKREERLNWCVVFRVQRRRDGLAVIDTTSELD